MRQKKSHFYGMWHHVAWLIGTNISKGPAASNFRAEDVSWAERNICNTMQGVQGQQPEQYNGSLCCVHWRKRQWVPPKTGTNLPDYTAPHSRWGSRFLQTLAPIYHTTQRHIPADLKLNADCHKISVLTHLISFHFVVQCSQQTCRT